MAKSRWHAGGSPWLYVDVTQTSVRPRDSDETASPKGLGLDAWMGSGHRVEASVQMCRLRTGGGAGFFLILYIIYSTIYLAAELQFALREGVGCSHFSWRMWIRDPVTPRRSLCMCAPRARACGMVDTRPASCVSRASRTNSSSRAHSLVARPDGRCDRVRCPRTPLTICLLHGRGWQIDRRHISVLTWDCPAAHPPTIAQPGFVAAGDEC
jgi:hypothetical protein